MHATLGRVLEARVEAGETGAHITAQVAQHWRAAGDQPRALAAAVRAAGAAERVNAAAETQALLERALELWERVPDAEGLAGSGRVDVLVRAAAAADAAGDPSRQEALLRRALELVPEDDARRRAALLLELSHALWNLHRQNETIEVLDSALALLPEGEQSAQRARLLGAKAKKAMLQARFAEAEGVAREALAVAEAVGDRESEAVALNALGIAVGGRGDLDCGIEHLREALEIARAEGLVFQEGSAWINLGDLLHLAGRTREGLAVVREAEEVGPDNPHRTGDWFSLAIADFSFALGDWDETEAKIPPPNRRHSGPTLAFLCSVRTRLALGRGDLETAAVEVEGLERATRDSTEPQFLGPYGVFSAELARRHGQLDRARAAIDEALDRVEYCSEDLIRITALSAAGLRVEGDAGQLARDRHDAEAEALVRTRADALLERTRLAAADAGPVEDAELATAEAEWARATGAEGSEAELWAAAASGWDALERPYAAAYAGWRRAEALAAERERDAASAVAAEALEGARALGSAWLVAELESLVARARLRVELPERDAAVNGLAEREPPADDPFGLTERERQVLALVASGATNREIGEQLHMAEKTASVHVSRILAKLEVRSRTEAAAVAHRHGMAEPVA